MRHLVICGLAWGLVSGCSQTESPEASQEQRQADLLADDAILQRFQEKRTSLQEQRRALEKIYGADYAGVRDIDYELIVSDRFIETRERQLQAKLVAEPEEVDRASK